MLLVLGVFKWVRWQTGGEVGGADTGHAVMTEVSAPLSKLSTPAPVVLATWVSFMIHDKVK